MKDLLRLSEASKLLGVSPVTLRYWDNTGKLKTVRTIGNQRRVPLEEVNRLLGKSNATRERTIVYARCSTKKQEGNLERQVGRLLEYCINQGWSVDLYKDIGSGLNSNRKGFKSVLKRISENDVKRVVIEYKDRITRFGFEIFLSYCEAFNVEVVILEKEFPKSFEEELTEDMISLLTSYSARIYGRRGGRKKV